MFHEIKMVYHVYVQAGMFCTKTYLSALCFAETGGFVILECLEPITQRPMGQILLDYLTDTVLSHKTNLFGRPHVSPDSKHVITLQSNNKSVIIVAQEVTEQGKALALVAFAHPTLCLFPSPSPLVGPVSFCLCDVQVLCSSS